MPDGSVYIDARVRRDRAEDDLKALKAEVKSTVKEIAEQEEKIDTIKSDTKLAEDLAKAKDAAQQTKDKLRDAQAALEQLGGNDALKSLRAQMQTAEDAVHATSSALQQLNDRQEKAEQAAYEKLAADPANRGQSPGLLAQQAKAMAAAAMPPEAAAQSAQLVQQLEAQKADLQRITAEYQEHKQALDEITALVKELQTAQAQQDSEAKKLAGEYQAQQQTLTGLEKRHEALNAQLAEEKAEVDKAAAAYYAEVDAVKAAEAAAKAQAKAAEETAKAQAKAAEEAAKAPTPPERKINTDHALRPPTEDLGTYADGAEISGFQARLQALSEALTGSFAEAADKGKEAAEAVETAGEEAAEKTQSRWRGALGAIGGFFKKVGSLGISAFKTVGSGLAKIGKLGLTAFGKVGNAAAKFAKSLLPSTKGLQHFGSRLREIVSGALIFNGISAALRKLTDYLKTAVGSTGTVKQAFANLQGAAATAATPIVQALTPALAALANAAATVFSYLARLISFFTGKSISGMQAGAKAMNSVGSAAGATAKQVDKAAKSLAGFDEINTLAEKQDDTSGGGGGGGASLAPNYGFEGSSPFLESVLAAIEAGEWEQVGALVAEKLNESMAAIDWGPIDATVSGWASNIARTLNGFVATLDWGLLGSTLANGLNVALHAVDTFFQTFDWGALGQGLGNGLNGLFAGLDWAALGRVLTDKFKAQLETLHGFLQTFDWAALGSDLATAAMAALNNVNWVQAAGDLSQAAIGLLTALTTLVQGLDWGAFGSTLAECLMSIDWQGVWQAVCELAGSILAGFGETWSGFFLTLAGNCEDGWLKGLLEWIARLPENIKTLCDTIVNSVKDFLGIHSPSTVFAEIGTFLVEGLFGGLSDTWHTITDFFSEKLDNLKQTFSSAWSAVKQTTLEVWNAIGAGIGAVWSGIVDIVKGCINGIIGAINGMVSGLTGGLNAVIGLLNTLSFDIPDWVPEFGGKSFGFSIPTLTAPQIPYLAQGAVIPPNREFLAVLGDQSHGTNVEAPLATIEQAVAGVMGDNITAMLAGFEALRDELAALRGDVQAIQVGDATIGRASARFDRRMAIIQGGV